MLPAMPVAILPKRAMRESRPLGTRSPLDRNSSGGMGEGLYEVRGQYEGCADLDKASEPNYLLAQRMRRPGMTLKKFYMKLRHDAKSYLSVAAFRCTYYGIN
jgi:hypothetical protein